MKTLLVFGEKTFKITVPNSAKITFGPFSPPRKGQSHPYHEQQLAGTIRIYEGKNVVAVFTHVTGYRDLSLEYVEQVAKEEGSIIWKSDNNGYIREEKQARKQEWEPAQIQDAQPKKQK